MRRKTGISYRFHSQILGKFVNLLRNTNLQPKSLLIEIGKYAVFLQAFATHTHRRTASCMRFID